MLSENHSSTRMVVFNAETHLDFTNNLNFGSVDSTTYERRMWTIRRTNAEAVYTRKARRTVGFGRELDNKLAGEVAGSRMAVFFFCQCTGSGRGRRRELACKQFSPQHDDWQGSENPDKQGS